MTDSTLSAVESAPVEQIELRPFSTIVGVFLGASLSLHLAALVYWVSSDTMSAATSFLIGEFLLGLSILRLVDGAFVFQDIRMFFLIFLFLYGGTLPVLVEIGLSGPGPGLPGAAFTYGTAIFGFNFVQWWYRQPWHDVPRDVFARYRPSFTNAVVVLLGLLWVLYFVISRGVTFTLTIDRGQVQLISSQVWVVSMFVMNGLVMYMMMGWPQLTKQARVLLVLSMVVFIGLQIFFGNRRDFLPMLVFLGGVVLTRRHAIIRWRTILVGFLLFASLTVLGIMRQIMEAPMLLLSDPIRLLVTQNEFVSPIQTLMYYVAHPHPLRLGWTYVTAPALLVPRVFWPEKPQSLSLQFLRDAFGTTGQMGYAYTPVTEAVLNFGWVGPFVVFSILSILTVKLVKQADLRPGFYFICFAFVVDFNRGDVGGLFYSLVFAGGAFWFMSLVSRLRWAPKMLRDAWPATDSGEPATSY
jgi:hypothetical protein